MCVDLLCNEVGAIGFYKTLGGLMSSKGRTSSHGDGEGVEVETVTIVDPDKEKGGSN